MGFKENLKMLRKSKRMTQEELGFLINKSIITVHRYEHGAIFPPRKILEKICKIFNVSRDEIISDIKFEENFYNLEEIKKRFTNFTKERKLTKKQFFNLQIGKTFVCGNKVFEVKKSKTLCKDCYFENTMIDCENLQEYSLIPNCNREEIIIFKEVVNKK